LVFLSTCSISPSTSPSISPLHNLSSPIDTEASSVEEHGTVDDTQMLVMCADGRLLKPEFGMRYVGTTGSRKPRHIRSEILDLDKANVGHLHLHPIFHGYSTKS
jgi:hypothetical protein